MANTAHLKDAAKRTVRSCIPVAARKRLAVWINRQKWLDEDRRSWWSQELVRDLASRDINEYHKFLWSRHLAYSAPYEVALKFGPDNMARSRRMFFADLRKVLSDRSIDPERDITSVFEVGCSLGYQLRYCETDLFTGAVVLDGSDIDEYAVRSGGGYLRDQGSKVRLACGDMEGLDAFLGGKHYDVTICSGVLMYLEENAAARVVDAMLRHTGVVVALSGLAHPELDNARLGHSLPRASDRSFIHNIDSMIERAGGTVLARRWEGGRFVDGHTIYFVFAGKVK